MNITLRDLMLDPQLFGDQFGGDSWNAWRALLCGFMGLPLTPDELATWQTITQRPSSPQEAAEELWLVVGRRGGKSQVAALLCVYYACFLEYGDRLSPGEVATVRVMATSRKEARTIFRYVSGLLNSNPMTKALIEREDRETLELANRVVIEIGTASFRSSRGYTFAAVLCDELAFWRSDESANPDREILDSCRPGLATLNGPLIALSSPYSRRGELWNTYRRYFGKESPILVAQAATRTMNPSLPQKIIDRAYERDAVSAAAEHGAEFRNDISAFISRDMLDNCTRSGPLILPPQHGIKYRGFVDVAGGGADHYTMAISYKDESRGMAVIAGVWGSQGDPSLITEQYSTILKSYGVTEIQGDRYAAAFPITEYKRHGITMTHTKLTRSDLYVEMVPRLQTGTVELPPDEKTITQFSMLERRTGLNGKDSINHPPGGHDDYANAAAGAAWLAMTASDYCVCCFVWGTEGCSTHGQKAESKQERPRPAPQRDHPANIF